MGTLVAHIGLDTLASFVIALFGIVFRGVSKRLDHLETKAESHGEALARIEGHLGIPTPPKAA